MRYKQPLSKSQARWLKGEVTKEERRELLEQKYRQREAVERRRLENEIASENETSSQELQEEVEVIPDHVHRKVDNNQSESAPKINEYIIARTFPCTACGKLLKTEKVVKHPLLDVGICGPCHDFLFSSPFKKAADGSEEYCRWCGDGGDIICCDACDKVFCKSCIRRNFGHNTLFEIVSCEEWLCFFCNKEPMTGLVQKFRVVEVAQKAQTAGDHHSSWKSTPKEFGTKEQMRRRKGVTLKNRWNDKQHIGNNLQRYLTKEFYKSGKSNSRAGGRGIPTTPNRHDYQNGRIHKEKSDFAMKGCSLQEAEKKEKEKYHVAPQVPVYIRPHQVQRPSRPVTPAADKDLEQKTEKMNTTMASKPLRQAGQNNRVSHQCPGYLLSHQVKQPQKEAAKEDKDSHPKAEDTEIKTESNSKKEVQLEQEDVEVQVAPQRSDYSQHQQLEKGRTIEAGDHEKDSEEDPQAKKQKVETVEAQHEAKTVPSNLDAAANGETGVKQMKGVKVEEAPDEAQNSAQQTVLMKQIKVEKGAKLERYPMCGEVYQRGTGFTLPT